MLLPTDAASQEPVADSAQSVVVARARAPRDAAVQYCLEHEESARLVVQFEGVLAEAESGVAYAPVDLDGQVDIMVDVSLEVYKLVRLVVHFTRCLYIECGGGLRHPRSA